MKNVLRALSLLFLGFQGVAAAAPTECFVLWQGRGDWQSTLTVSGGSIARVEPYMFLDPRDKTEDSAAQRIVCSTHSRGNAAGLHLFIDGQPDCRVRLETNRATQEFALTEIAAVEVKVVPVAASGGFLLFGRGDPALGPREYYRSKLPSLFVPPAPRAPVRLPTHAGRDATPVTVKLSAAPAGDVSIRRVGHNDGTLYLEVFASAGGIGGTAEIALGTTRYPAVKVDSSVWLALEPRIGRIGVDITWPGGGRKLSVPTTLVEARGPQLYLNGEPFLIKGTLPGELTPEVAEFIHTLGMNTLRGGTAPRNAEQFGFMAIASLQGAGLKKLGDYHGAKGAAEIERDLKPYLAAKDENGREAADNPNTLIIQLDNERATTAGNPLDTEGGNTGADPWSEFLRGDEDDYGRLNLILARAWNVVKPMAPVLPLGYANESQGYVAPAFLDVYLHNSYLPRDRYSIPFRDYVRIETGGRRPFVNTEWGANRFTPEAYHGAKNSPVLEKIQAWGYRQTWTNFMAAGTNGGTSYKLYDSTKDTDQGTKNFGMLTADGQPKLACWEAWHMWRDFEVTPGDGGLVLQWQRDYFARDAKLTITRADAPAWSADLGEFAPSTQRTMNVPFTPARFRWRIDYATHHGLKMVATGGWPAGLEEEEFAARLAKRPAANFLRTLMTAEVVTADGHEPPSALVDMAVAGDIIPIAFRCADGTTYVTAFTRRRLRGSHYVKADIYTAFAGDVVRIDEWTGEPVAGEVPHASEAAGLVLKAVDIPSIPGPIGARSNEPLTLPVFRISRPSH